MAAGTHERRIDDAESWFPEVVLRVHLKDESWPEPHWFEKLRSDLDWELQLQFLRTLSKTHPQQHLFEREPLFEITFEKGSIRVRLLGTAFAATLTLAAINGCARSSRPTYSEQTAKIIQQAQVTAEARLADDASHIEIEKKSPGKLVVVDRHLEELTTRTPPFWSDAQLPFMHILHEMKGDRLPPRLVAEFDRYIHDRWMEVMRRVNMPVRLALRVKLDSEPTRDAALARKTVDQLLSEPNHTAATEYKLISAIRKRDYLEVFVQLLLGMAAADGVLGLLERLQKIIRRFRSKEVKVTMPDQATTRHVAVEPVHPSPTVIDKAIEIAKSVSTGPICPGKFKTALATAKEAWREPEERPDFDLINSLCEAAGLYKGVPENPGSNALDRRKN